MSAERGYSVSFSGLLPDGRENWTATCACGWYRRGASTRAVAVAELGYHWRTCSRAGVSARLATGGVTSPAASLSDKLLALRHEARSEAAPPNTIRVETPADRESEWLERQRDRADDG